VLTALVSMPAEYMKFCGNAIFSNTARGFIRCNDMQEFVVLHPADPLVRR
jgi:hypothetical protein